jgi:hypothetical protein
MLVFNKYFYKNKKSKLYFGDRVAVLNDFIYQIGGSKPKDILPLSTKECNSRFSMSQTIWNLMKDIEESNNIHDTK